MAGTFRREQVREVALYAVDAVDRVGVSESAKYLDIITSRLPLGGTARKQRKDFVWLTVEAPDYVHDRLSDPVILPIRGFFDDGEPTTDIYYDKRRYCIPATRLSLALGFTYDESRSRDRADEYQPFFSIDPDFGEWLTTRQPLRYEGLIFDKQTGVYLG